jgi:hypothetical protein
MDKRLTAKPKPMKLLEENTGESSWALALVMNFCQNKWDCKKLKSFCTQKKQSTEDFQDGG